MFTVKKLVSHVCYDYQISIGRDVLERKIAYIVQYFVSS